MKIIVKNIELIQRFNEDMKGVYTLSDLKSIVNTDHIQSFYRQINALEANGILQKFIRGFYLSKSFDLNILSQKLKPVSYISFENVLAKELIIGTVPKNSVKAVYIGKTKKEYKSCGVLLQYFTISENLFFGFNTVSGINYATKEKAFLDVMYFYNRGAKFYFDIYSDIDTSSLNKKMIDEYLKKYKNQKFVKFVKDFLNENTST